MPAGITLETVHRAEAVVVDIPTARAVVHLDGGHLTSWTPAGHRDLLWVSPTSRYGGAPIRGGIPLVGPWFGPGRAGDRPVKHGWLRTQRWSLRSAVSDGQQAVLELSLAEPAEELEAQLELRVGAELAADLTITAGAEGLELEAALHTYLAVEDVRQIAIDGLGGAPFLDNTRGLAADVQHEQTLRLTGSTDRIYDTAGQITILDEAGRRRIVSTPRGTAQTVVWNPGEELAAGMDDLPEEAWPRFVCIEPALAKDRCMTLAPHRSHTLGVTYRLEDAPRP